MPCHAFSVLEGGDQEDVSMNIFILFIYAACSQPKCLPAKLERCSGQNDDMPKCNEVETEMTICPYLSFSCTDLPEEMGMVENVRSERRGGGDRALLLTCPSCLPPTFFHSALLQDTEQEWNVWNQDSQEAPWKESSKWAFWEGSGKDYLCIMKMK